MKEIYLLSGLGADERVFNYLDLGAYKANYIRWANPDAGESIAEYARKLLTQIKSECPILVGVSFGGIIAVEIGKLIKTEKIILISSAKTSKDIPLHYKLMGKISFNKLMPQRHLKKMHSVIAWFFSVSDKAERELLEEIINDTDECFLEWAIDQIINWENEVELKNAVLIHGTKDRLLPNDHADYSIIDGGHFMIVNRCKEVSTLLHKLLSEKKEAAIVNNH
jgi:pimeloyl-ACP methyl ester carboxylesterase